MKKLIATVSIILLLAGAASAARLNPESFYGERDCKYRGGAFDEPFQNKTRCDCLTDLYAVEYDFADKWYEGVTQALYYALMSKRRAGLGLIMENPEDVKYWYRLQAVIDEYDLPLTIWQIKP